MLTLVRRLAARIRAFFQSRALDQEFDEELRIHVAMMTEDHVRRGMTPVEAHRAAAIKLGAASSLAEQHRRVRGFPALESVLLDLRHAVRRLAGRPLQTLPIVLILSRVLLWPYSQPGMPLLPSQRERNRDGQ